MLSMLWYPVPLKLRPNGAIQICLLLLFFFTFLITLVSIDPRGKNKKLKTNITGSIITIIKLSDEVSAFIAIPGA